MILEGGMGQHQGILLVDTVEKGNVIVSSTREDE
jgi:hypothetical protein